MRSSTWKNIIIVSLILLTFFFIANALKTNWFQGSTVINTSLEDVEHSLSDLGAYFVGVISKMPSMTRVKLVEQGEDYVIIKTNEGLITRTNISKKTDGKSIIVEFDEAYQVEGAITTKAHFRDEFTESEEQVTHRLAISNLKAPGFMGFFYKNFRSSSMGQAFSWRKKRSKAK
jgi:hypothetical protein